VTAFDEGVSFQASPLPDPDLQLVQLLQLIQFLCYLGAKNVMLLTTTVPILGKTRDDDKNKPAIYKRYDFGYYFKYLNK
jgi:hypothetical protein